MFNYFQTVQTGEEMLATGDIQNGVEHLALAVAVCGQPHNLLGVFQSTLPPQIYHLLLQNLEVNNFAFAVSVLNQVVCMSV